MHSFFFLFCFLSVQVFFSFYDPFLFYILFGLYFFFFLLLLSDSLLVLVKNAKIELLKVVWCCLLLMMLILYTFSLMKDTVFWTLKTIQKRQRNAKAYNSQSRVPGSIALLIHKRTLFQRRGTGMLDTFSRKSLLVI